MKKLSFLILLVAVLLSGTCFSQDAYLVYSSTLKTGNLTPDEIIKAAARTLALRFESGKSSLRFIDNTVLVLDCRADVAAILGKSVLEQNYRYRLSVKVNDDQTCELIADEYKGPGGPTVSYAIADQVAESSKSKRKQQQYRALNKEIYESLELNYQLSRSGLDLALLQASKAKQ